MGTDQNVTSLIIEGKAHSMELLRLNNVVSNALTGDKACDRIAETALVIGVAESVPRLLVAPRLRRKLLGTEGRFDGSGCGLLLEGIVLPDVYVMACEMPPSVGYDAFPITVTAVEPSVAGRCT